MKPEFDTQRKVEAAFKGKTDEADINLRDGLYALISDVLFVRDRKNNDKFHIAVDLGAMFWGGSPRVVTHDGTDLIRDVSNISGKVGNYVSLAKTFKVFPVLDVRLVYNIF